MSSGEGNGGEQDNIVSNEEFERRRRAKMGGAADESKLDNIEEAWAEFTPEERIRLNSYNEQEGREAEGLYLRIKGMMGKADLSEKIDLGRWSLDGSLNGRYRQVLFELGAKGVISLAQDEDKKNLGIDIDILKESDTFVGDLSSYLAIINADSKFGSVFVFNQGERNLKNEFYMKKLMNSVNVGGIMVATFADFDSLSTYKEKVSGKIQKISGIEWPESDERNGPNKYIVIGRSVKS